MTGREKAAITDRPQRARATPKSYVVAGRMSEAPTLVPGLYIVATPIGNLGDITLRALQTLAGADLIACEDTRVTRKLLDHYGITTPLTPYHEHNAAAARPKLVASLAQGSAVALVSDAGTPLISDPGFKLVRAAREAGHAVMAVPGASAVLAALSTAGQPTDRFFFEGFLPAKATQRRARIVEISRIPATLVLYETGPRLAGALADLAAMLGGRDATVCRELTKLYEDIRSGALTALAAHYATAAAPKGEIVIVIAPPRTAALPEPDEVDDLLRAALARVSLKDAVAEVASVTGQPRRAVYRRALELAKAVDGER